MFQGTNHLHVVIAVMLL